MEFRGIQMQAAPTILVFCDLDDTVLDPRTSCFDAATGAALDRIAHERIPIMLCSSKTRGTRGDSTGVRDASPVHL